MNITWINDSRTRFDGAFVTLRCSRAPAGNVRLCLYFSSRAVESLGLQRGERLLVGLDEETQQLAFKPTMFGGNALKGRNSGGDLECYVTLPIFNLPEPQYVQETQLKQLADSMAMPFAFDATQFKGWRKSPALKMAA